MPNAIFHRTVNLGAFLRPDTPCTERCIMNNKTGDAAGDCIKRTCERQNPGCAYPVKDSGGGKLIDRKPAGNSRASGVLVPRGSGVLSNQTRPSNQQPANVRPRAPLAGSGVVIR
jgi:hypothetical protein